MVEAPPTNELQDSEMAPRRPHSVESLHVVRTLRTYLSKRYNVGLALLSKSGQISWIDPIDGAPNTEAQQQLRRLISIHEAQPEHIASMRNIAAGRSGRVMSHLFGIRASVSPCRVGGRSGRIVAWPFFTREDQRVVAAERLIELDVPPRQAERFVSEVSLVETSGLAAIADLIAILADEIDRFEAEIDRATRRLAELRTKGRTRYSHIIGRSRPMLRLYRLMDRIVRADSTVYIHGENGTGKELVAAEIHNHSRRAGRPFIVQNCSALNDNLLESELFGHRMGAFTGAVSDKPGLFELADTGTFFLDEIGDMSPALQVKLLRVLQDGTFTPVGGSAARKVDVRVLCATNRDLQAMVAEGTFREDLFYRINVITLQVPPLRDRLEDIPMLTEYFLQRTQLALGSPQTQKRFTRPAIDVLKQYDWPGNVRELENEIERVVVMSGALVTEIDQEMLSPHIRMRPLLAPQRNTTHIQLPEAMEQLERTMIFDELVSQGWNKTRAARRLGISRRNLIRKCAVYGFDKDELDR